MDAFWSKVALLFFLSATFVPRSYATDPMPLRLGELYWLLDRACWQGDELSAEILLKAGADPTGLKGYADFRKGVDHIGVEPTWHLCQAAYGGHVEIVKQLLQAGADPNLAQGEGETALTVATGKNQIDIVHLLLKAGADKNYKSHQGTATQIAQRRGYADILSLLRSSK